MLHWVLGRMCIVGITSRILLIFEFLWESTDEANPTALERLKDHLQSCGLSRPDSRTIKADIDQLIELGVDIIIDRRVQNQYFIGARHFDTVEVKLLIDAVQSSRFITSQKSKALIRKLGAFIEPQQKQLLKRQFYTVSPYVALWNNDQYYMVGYSEERKLAATYRVDRSSHLTVTEEPARKRPADFAISDYFGQTFSV